MQIKITPPSNSALDLNLSPNTFPIFTPDIDITSVIIPIKVTAGIMLTFKNSKVIPTAKHPLQVLLKELLIQLIPYYFLISLVFV